MIDVITKAVYLWASLMGIVIVFYVAFELGYWIMTSIEQKLQGYTRYALHIAGAVTVFVLCFLGSLIAYVMGV